MKLITQLEDWSVQAHRSPHASESEAAHAEDWLPARVPGTIHEDLLRAGRIPDPFVGLNELEVEWVSEQDWLYRCTFKATRSVLAADHVDVCFDGLDTFATVWLNGTPILTSDNMFIPHRIAVKALLQEGENEIRVRFDSAVRRSKEREVQHGSRPAWNPNANRIYARKAQYHYGWDWGPVLTTAGIWRPVRLEAYSSRIASLHCPVHLSDDLSSATITANVSLELRDSIAGHVVQFSLISPVGKVLEAVSLPAEHGLVSHTFTVAQPQLWYPNGYGEQPLYIVETELLDDDEALDQHSVRVGLRRVRLVQEPVQHESGRTFLFEVNGIPIFCGGANWIPADSFPSRVTPERYRRWLTLAAEANMVMLRVWGGGIYEHNEFYQLCDELGLMVWQDFMFACGMYPADDWFLDSVRAEAEANVMRLRDHACIVLWCGNNEDYQIAESLHAYNPSFHGDFRATAFPAREIYERLLPEVCARLDPTRPYWPGSPYSGETLTPDKTVGDRHTWEIWHGPMHDYKEYPQWEGRFVSEFGMQSHPSIRTIKAFADKDEQFPGSRTLDWHNKAGSGGVQRLAGYVALKLRPTTDLEDLVYDTQLIQAEALSAAYAGWRRRWRGPGQYAVAGALVWQLNDCWPVTSWALADYWLRPKPAYYVVRRKLAPLTVELVEARDRIEVWAFNARLEDIQATLELTAWTLEGHQISEEQRQVMLGANRSTEFAPVREKHADPCVYGARLYVEGSVVARAVLFPEPFKYFEFPAPQVKIDRKGETLRISAHIPVKGLWLDAGDDIEWSDNMLDLLPDDPQVVQAKGLSNRQVRTRSLR